MHEFKNYKFNFPAEIVKTEGDAVCYTINQRPLWQREFVLDGKDDFATEEYIVLEYSAKDLQRFCMLRQSVISGVKGEEETGLLFANEMITDGKRHRVIAKCGKGEYDFLRLRLKTKSPHVEFKLYRAYTCSYEELPERLEAAEYSEKGYKTIDISSFTNDFYSYEPGQVDGGIGCKSGTFGIEGIPFALTEKIVRPTPPPKENDELIKNFNRENVPVRLCRPKSRESLTEIPVNSEGKEIYFILYMDKEIHERWGFCAPDPTILGGSQGEVMMPAKINDIERYAVYINYEDGTVDECFPENIKTHRHEITGEIGAYGVRTNGKKIKSVGFEDRIIDTDISLCALTVNTDASSITGELFPERSKGHEADFDYKGRFDFDGDVLTVQNGGFYTELSTENGLFVKRAVSAYSYAMTINGALLKIRDNDVLTENFERCRIEIDEEAKITYRYKTLFITVKIELEQKDGIKLSLKAENRGDEISVGILFPVISDIKFGTDEDTWYFLPKYQNTESNGSCYVYEESAPSYPMQFMDIFSPNKGAGFALNTRERDLKVRKYALIKQHGRTDAFVEYPSDYVNIKQYSVFAGSETVLYVHKGDWRESYKSYKKWLDSWYEPYKCQNKKWYREKFWLVAEITDFVETNFIYKLPVWYEKENNKYNFRMIMDEMTKLYGETPDILHMWAWTWSEEYQHMLWGNFGKYDYDRLGGLENFRNALKDVSEATGAEISLYLHPTLLSEVYPEAEKYFPTLRVKNSGGRYIGIKNESFRMCHANKEWREHALKMYPRVHEETGVRLLYVDEFSLRVDNRCYAENHGHEVPSNLLKTDRSFISELRDSVPEEVVLYGEYYAVDINARYIDCNISYYILDSINEMIEQGHHSDDASDIYGKVFTDIYRFAFPKIVQLILPMAMRNKSWQPLKATFFNGEAIYDSFWDAEESRGRSFMAKSFRIKKEYADCFSSDYPETMIESVSDAICVNKYPGDGRCMYTLFNRSYHTYEGTVLKLRHKEGRRYVDAWNGCDAPFTVKDGYAYIKSRVIAQSTGAIAEIYE